MLAWGHSASCLIKPVCWLVTLRDERVLIDDAPRPTAEVKTPSLVSYLDVKGRRTQLAGGVLDLQLEIIMIMRLEMPIKMCIMLLNTPKL